MINKTSIGVKAILENSEDIIKGLVKFDREIPASKDMQFQASSDKRTQIQSGVWAIGGG